VAGGAGPSSSFVSGGVGCLLSVVVWGPHHHSCLVVLGPLHCLHMVVWGPLRCAWCWALVVVHGWCCWVVFLGTCRSSWVEVLGLPRCSWLVVLAPRSPFGGLGTCHFSWVEVPSFEGEGRGSSFVCAGAHCHSSVLVFCAVRPLLSFAIHHHLLSVSVVTSCLSSIVSRQCCPVLFCVVTWWQAFPLGGG